MGSWNHGHQAELASIFIGTNCESLHGLGDWHLNEECTYRVPCSQHSCTLLVIIIMARKKDKLKKLLYTIHLTQGSIVMTTN